MKRPFTLIALCFSLLANTPISAQSTNATLSGTVTDPTDAVVEGAVITVRNIKTGVTLTTTSNDSGVYQFASLQPGIYELMVEKSGFRKLVYSEANLDVGARVKLNLQLEAGAVTEAVNVSAGAEGALGRESTSVGGVITGGMIRDLPLPGRNSLDLVLTQAGVLSDNISGARIGTLNITRDGIDVMDRRINSGVFSTVFNSVDLIEEVRVVTSPADAEFGRGSAQIQLITRSGTNEFHGSVFESHRNTALNANEWANNLRGDPRDVLIRNQFGGRIGGPIKKNKTFFHFVYEGQRLRQKNDTTATVLTDQARAGIFRFFPGVRNGNAIAAVPTVDLNGNPLRPSSATGDLQSVSVFGRDPNRRGFDPSGLVQRYLAVMPRPNNFRTGDGLNTAGFTWARSSTSDFNNYSVRLDHHFNERHHLSYSYTREAGENLNGFLAQPFPESPVGTVEDRNRFHSFSLTSSLGPTLLNDFRVGAQRPLVRFFAPWELEGGTDLLATANGQLFAPIPILTSTAVNVSNDPQGRISPVYIFSDNLTWLRGRHSFKGGAEVRFVSTNGFNSFTVLPRANIGTGGVSIQGISTIPGIGLNSGTAQSLLNDLSGSLTTVQQAFNSPGGASPAFVAGEGKRRTWKQREFSLFFKDDFRVKPSLTLNLGVRYEFYGVPFDGNGKAAGLVGGSAGIFGTSGTSEAALFKPGITGGSLTQLELVGPGSPNSSRKLYNNDWNNLAPALGLSWSLPWLGRDKTVLRMGYGIGYEKNSLRIVDVVAGDQPGLRVLTTFRSPSYLDLGAVGLPLVPTGHPLSVVPLTDRTQTVRAFDSNLRTAYVQNWNVTLQRNLGWRTVAEVRYVGNKGSKLIRGTNVNEVNIFENGILEAFLITQAGGNSPLLDRIFMGLNIPGLGVVNGTTRTGSDAVRVTSTTAAQLAAGNVGAFASFLNTTVNFTGEAGGLLRRAGLPENFIVVNPQFVAANLTGNFANSSYHSFQVDVTKRFSSGLQFQSNYTWSKALGEEEGADQEMLDSYRNGRARSFDKRRMSFDVRHVMRNSWTYALPFGPGTNLLNSKNSILSRLVGGWQLGGILNLFSGTPLTITSDVTSFNQFTDNTPTVVGSFPQGTGQVKVTGDGVFYFGGLQQVPDPSIANLTTKGNIQSQSTLRAIADASGRILLINPVPGTLGSLAPRYIEGPGSFRFDLNMIKRIRITEVKNLELRATAIDVLNHPIWNNPNTNINSVNFGRITGADGNRIIILEARFSF